MPIDMSPRRRGLLADLALAKPRRRSSQEAWDRHSGELIAAFNAGYEMGWRERGLLVRAWRMVRRLTR